MVVACGTSAVSAPSRLPVSCDASRASLGPLRVPVFARPTTVLPSRPKTVAWTAAAWPFAVCAAPIAGHRNTLVMTARTPAAFHRPNFALLMLPPSRWWLSCCATQATEMLLHVNEARLVLSARDRAAHPTVIEERPTSRRPAPSELKGRR